MENYRRLYCLQLEHEYYPDGKCSCIDVRINPSSKELLRRRGLIFKKTKENEWCLFGNKEGAECVGTDTLFFDFYMLDSSFVYYTDFKNLKPTESYELKLPNDNREFVTAVEKKSLAPRINSIFCVATLKLDEMLYKETLVTNLFKFHSTKVYWEYVFIPRDSLSYNGLSYDGPVLELKEKLDRIFFDQSKVADMWGRRVWLVRSRSAIPMVSCYDYELALYVNENSKLIDNIPYPVPGLFPIIETREGGTVDLKVIRQVSYFNL